MTEQLEQPRTLSTAIPAIPFPQPSSAPVSATDDDARERIAALEKEARALGNVPEAALLFHEMGLLWEAPLKHARNAAVAYQSAFKLAPRFLANIRSARRLFAEVGNWVMVVQLIEAESNATESKRTKAALLFERSQILEQRLSKETEALAAIKQCLDLEPEDVTLLVQLESVFAEKGDHESLVKVYCLLAENIVDDGARAVFFTSAGLLLEDRIKDLERASALFREAFAIDRKDPQLLAAIKRVAQREGTPEEELAALAAEAEVQGPLAAPTYLQISKAYERLNRSTDALAALLAARRVSPLDPLVLSELARMYESQGQFSELADVLLAWVSVNTDESEFVMINTRLGSLYEQLERDADAIGRYSAILERVPGHVGALTSLGKLYYRTQNWQGLLETYEAEARTSDEPRAKAARLYKAGETLEERLGRVEEAIAHYRTCLELVPGFLAAQKALTRLFEKLGRWEDLISMHEQDLLQTADKEQQMIALNKMAVLYEDRMKDLDKAIECLKRVMELSPGHVPNMRNLARLYERSSRWKELLGLNEEEIRLASDTKQVVSLSHRNAEILEDQIQDRPAAVAAWERVLQLSPNYLPALRSLGRLYGQDGRWEALIKMYRAEAETGPSTDQAAGLIQKIGELFEQKVKDLDQAISSYREVLMLSPTYFPALRALARIYRTQGDWESLIEILRSEAANRADPTERANAMFQASAIWEDQLHKVQNAIDGYQEVLRLAPNHTTAIQQLERLLTTKDDVKELIVLLDRQTQVGSDAGRVGAWLKLARLYLDRINEPARAAACCDSALAIDKSNLNALRLLERIRANDKPRRAEVRARVAEAIGDPKLSAAIKLSNFEAGDPNAPQSTEVVNQLKEAYLADPSDESLGLVLERALFKTGDAKGLVELYERWKTNATELNDKLQLQLRVADLFETKLNDIPQALVAFDTALELAPELFPALIGRARCAKQLGNYAIVHDSLDTIARTSKEPGSAIAALLEAARLSRDVEHADAAAIELFRRVLEKEPFHPEAGPALEEMLARVGGSDELVALHEKRAEAKLAQKDVLSGAREFFQAARICLDAKKDRTRAMALLDKALMAMPMLPEALDLKGTLSLETQNYVEAAAAWAVRAQQGGEPKELIRLHLKLGAIYQDHLSDQTRAAAHLQSAIAADPANTEALDRLAAIHTASRNWTGAADCLRQLLELDTNTQDRVKHTLLLARITDEGFNDAAQAASLYRKALEMLPGDAQALERLTQLYERTGATTELIHVLDQQAQNAPDLKKAVALKMRIAGLQAGLLNEPQKAMVLFKQITEIEPGNVAAHSALADLYTRDPASIALAIETHRNVLRIDPTRAESLHALFKMWESLRQLDKAFCVVSVLMFLKSANEAEAAFYTEHKNRLPSEFRNELSTPDLVTLHHPLARAPIVEVLRAVGDQFTKLYPPQLENQSIDKKADRLKSDHAVHKAIHAVTHLFSIENFDVYQAKKGLIYLETTDPLSICVGPEVVRRFNIREQRFLYGRGAFGLYAKTAVLRKLSMGELGDVLGNSVRIHQPSYEGLGRRNEDQSKQLRKAYSRKALKLLEEPADAALHGGRVSIDGIVQGLGYSAERAALLACADLNAGFGLMLREEGNPVQGKLDSAELVIAAVHERPDIKEAINFAVSDDLFRLRNRVGVSVG